MTVVPGIAPASAEPRPAASCSAVCCGGKIRGLATLLLSSRSDFTWNSPRTGTKIGAARCVLIERMGWTHGAGSVLAVSGSFRRRRTQTRNIVGVTSINGVLGEMITQASFNINLYSCLLIGRLRYHPKPRGGHLACTVAVSVANTRMKIDHQYKVEPHKGLCSTWSAEQFRRQSVRNFRQAVYDVKIEPQREVKGLPYLSWPQSCSRRGLSELQAVVRELFSQDDEDCSIKGSAAHTSEEYNKRARARARETRP